MNSLPARVAELEARFEEIARTRMQGVPMLNPELRVQAVGFEPTGAEGEPGEAGWIGVLVTPWFMNLVWLPALEAPPHAQAPRPPTRVGVTRHRRVGTQNFPFIGAHEEGFGPFEACSLFSPMFEFVDHAAALATAQAVLQTLREPPPQPSLPPTDAALPPPAAQPSRRAMLFGRRGDPRSGVGA